MSALDPSQLQRQFDFEQIFQTFAHQDYIAHMQPCYECSGVGCPRCTGRGFRHTSVSIAFGRGLNAATADKNPYHPDINKQEFIAYFNGDKCRIRQAVKRVRITLGLSSLAADL